MTEPGPESSSDVGSDSEVEELQAGLREPQKRVSSKYFYDHRGSELFEQITRLPEYYLTRTEGGLLARNARRWIEELRPCSLVELGAGSAEKTRILLEALVLAQASGSAPVYVPIDVSAEFLEATAESLRTDYPGLKVQPFIGDMSKPGFSLGPEAPRPVLFALLGSTIGNFTAPQAVQLITTVAESMQDEDAFLMGADLRPGRGKTREELEAAYNDSQGVTAAFNRNLLLVLNERFGTDFAVSDFEHRAFYEPGSTRIEMHLVALRPFAVSLAGHAISFRQGETLRTEISCKYDREAVAYLFGEAGLRVDDWVTDPQGRYALALGRPR